MADEVKIHVEGDADLRKIEEAKRKIDELNKAADAYEKKGMDTAARSARGDARNLERDVNKLARERAAEQKRVESEAAKEAKANAAEQRRMESEAARDLKERVAAHKRVSDEMREQEALRKAGLKRVGQAVMTGQDIAATGNVSGALLGAGMRSGNPIAMIAAAIASAVTGIAALRASETDKDTAQGLRIRERGYNASYRLNRAAGVFGSRGELMSAAQEAGEEISQKKAARPSLDEKARVKWNAPSTWTWGGLRQNEGQRERDENEGDIARLERERALALKAAQKKYIQEEGGLEIDALRQRSKRTLAGSRAAIIDEEAGKAFAKYKEVLKESGNESLAKEAATLTYQNRIRERQALAGASLVDGRSGGAEIAAAASWGARSTPLASEIGAQLNTLIGVVHSGNQLSQLKNQAK